MTDSFSNDTYNSGAKAAALSIFESTKQRFFGQILIGMKLPSLIPAIRTDLARGESVVIQLVSTSEAMLNRALAALNAEDRANLDIELSPKEFVLSGSPDKRISLQSRFMSSGSRAGADLRDEDIGFTPDN